MTLRNSHMYTFIVIPSILDDPFKGNNEKKHQAPLIGYYHTQNSCTQVERHTYRCKNAPRSTSIKQSTITFILLHMEIFLVLHYLSRVGNVSRLCASLFNGHVHHWTPYVHVILQDDTWYTLNVMSHSIITDVCLNHWSSGLQCTTCMHVQMCTYMYLVASRPHPFETMFYNFFPIGIEIISEQIQWSILWKYTQYIM